MKKIVILTIIVIVLIIVNVIIYTSGANIQTKETASGIKTGNSYTEGSGKEMIGIDDTAFEC